MKKSTNQGRTKINFRFTGVKNLFAAIFFLIISITGILPNDANAIVFGVRPNTIFHPATPTIQAFVEFIWAPAGPANVLTMPGYVVASATAVTWNSDNLLYYAIITDDNGVRHLATVDPLTGICAEIGVLPQNLSSLTYNSDLGILYGMSGSGGPNPSTLYSINISNAAVTTLGGPYPIGTEGEVIAYNFIDAKIYHWSSGGMETIDPITFLSTPITLSGATISEVQGAVFLGDGTFSVTDFNFAAGTFTGFTVSTGGVVSFPVALPYQLRGLGFYNSLLPVELSSFASTVTGRNVTLNWATTTETNNAGFDIERSSVNGSWTKIANVAGNGTTTAAQSYSYTDRNLASGNYNYRLKQTDFNGNFEYFNLSNEVIVGIPTKYDLSQNYPNPFNPSTSIAYEIPFDGQVSLKIFDMSGKEVATLVNEVKTAGYYTYNFNASSLSSGVYFYSLSANNFTATKKMMLLK